LEVYNNPINLFVADFIGAPGMNRLKGKLADSDRGLVVDLGPLGLTAPLPPTLAENARKNRVRDVVYGFRPETVVQVGQGGISLPVTFVERIGARTIVHLDAGGQTVKAVFDNDVGLTAGETAAILVDPGAVRLFDAASGLSIGRAV
jgi:multiple sugar transport system ATP-binding protein